MSKKMLRACDAIRGAQRLSCSKKTDVTFHWVLQNECLKWLSAVPLCQHREQKSCGQVH